MPAKFFTNRTNGGGVLTSYRSLNMAATESEIYFRVQVWWLHSFKEMEVYLHTTFRWNISIHGWDQTTSGFRNQRPPYWNSTSCFHIDPCKNQHVILHPPDKFHSNRTNGGGVMT